MQLIFYLEPLERLRDEADFVYDDDVEAGLGLNLNIRTKSVSCYRFDIG